jgi:hypothetical protein
MIDDQPKPRGTLMPAYCKPLPFSTKVNEHQNNLIRLIDAFDLFDTEVRLHLPNLCRIKIYDQLANAVDALAIEKRT